MLKSKFFWSMAVIAAIIIFLAALNTGRAYKGETDVLLIPKSPKAVRNIDQIIANAQTVPQSLSFYDKLLERNQDIVDPAAGFADPERKAFWNNELSVEHIGASGVVRVDISNNDQLQAEIISRQTATDIVAVMGRYYDTTNDLDMRIIDGPIVYLLKNNNPAVWALLSAVLGILLGAIVFLLFTLLKTAVPKTKFAPPVNFKRENIYSFLDKKTVEKNEKKKSVASLNLGLSAKEKPYTVSTKKAGAPENLPVGNDFVISALKRTQAAEEEKAEVETETETEKTHEATPEEVRERLNKLLSGGM